MAWPLGVAFLAGAFVFPEKRVQKKQGLSAILAQRLKHGLGHRFMPSFDWHEDLYVFFGAPHREFCSDCLFFRNAFKFENIYRPGPSGVAPSWCNLASSAALTSRR